MLVFHTSGWYTFNKAECGGSCTLEVEAIVIDNKSDLKSDSDYGQSYRYNQVVEYVVEDKNTNNYT